MLESVNVIAELENLRIPHDYSSAKSVKVLCPFHKDSSPSLIFYLETSRFECKACNAKGDIADYMARLAGADRSTVALLLMKKYNITKGEKSVAVQTIEDNHAEIWQALPFLEELRKRCISDDTIRKYRLGLDHGRIGIPVMDLTGSQYVNIRRYLPGASGADKMKNLRGKGKLRIYPHDQLHYDQILLCGGEIKALAAAQELNAHGIGCVCVTGGEGEWKEELTLHFAGKEVYVCFDVDQKGQRATAKLCRILYAACKHVYPVTLPLDISDYPTGDINDYLAQGGELLPLIDEATIFDPRLRVPDWTVGEYEDRSLSDATRAEHIGERSAVSCLITGVQEQKHSVPIKVQVDCFQDDKACGNCPVAVMDRDTFSIAPENPAIIAMIGAPDDKLQTIMGRACGIPSSCRKHSVVPLARATAQVCVVSPPLTLTATDTSSSTMQKVVAITESLEPNESYRLSCRAQPDPGNQESVLLCSAVEPTMSSLHQFSFERRDDCDIFVPDDWSKDAIGRKLDDIYDDFQYNVTHIRARQDLHLAIDLTYHSALMLQLERKPQRGWLETLIIGDSSQGKTQATVALQQHYGLGHKIDMKNASVAGIIGGLAQVGTLWVVLWGAFPMHDMRLIIAEELKGASTDVIAAMTDMRSSGVAGLDKIKAGRRLARVRLIATTNPRSDRPMETYSYGIDAVKELCGAPEDVRRFDLALAVAKGDLSTDVIHDLQLRERPHVYESEICHDLLMWCWTRKAEQILFGDETKVAINNASKRFCAKYSEAIPLVDAGSMRYKLARMATALAGRTFSTDDGVHLVVRTGHVEYIEDWLNRVYDAPAMRYNEFSAKEKKLASIGNPDELNRILNSVPHNEHFAEYLRSNTVFNAREVSSHSGYDQHQSDALVSELLRVYAIAMRGPHQFILTAGFRRFLASDLVLAERPDHVKNNGHAAASRRNVLDAVSKAEF